MDTERRVHPRAAVNWKCPLCDTGFRSEKEKDIHMANNCLFQGPMDGGEMSRRKSVGNTTRKKREPDIKQASHSTANLSLSSKVLVCLTWYKHERYTGEREINFYDKNGEMFKLRFSADEKSSRNGFFKGDCRMELGEHEGSLGVADLGVFDVLPFKVLMKDRQTVSLQIVGDKELYNGSRDTGQASAIKHTSEDKRVSKEQLEQAETTIQLLTRKNEDSQREFKKVEEEYKYTITKLEARITEKEKEMSHRNEELRSAQDELGRFSERSQSIIDRHDADNSKYDESLLLIEKYKKRVSEQRETISGLKQEADNSRATHNQSDSENNALQIEVSDLRCELKGLESERENLFSEIRQIKNEKDQFMCALTAQAQTINKSAKQSKGIFNESGEQQQLLERIMELEGESKKKDEAMQQLSVQSGDLLRKCSLLEKELKQLKSGMSIGDVYEGNLVTIREKERMIKETSRNNEEFQQRIQDLEMDLVLGKSECEESKVKVRDLRKEMKLLEKKLSFRETESVQMRQENLKMKFELNKARSVLVSNFNSQNQNKAEEVGHDDEKSMFSISQSLGPEFKRENIGGYNIEFLPDERRQKMELDERVSQMNSHIKELKQKLEFCSEENESLRKELRTKERELNSVKHKLNQTEENLSATQTYLDEERFKLELKEKGAKKMEIPDPASGTTLTAPTAPTAPTTRSTKQTKYKYTTIFFAKKGTQAYSLNQVENPKDHFGGIVLCRSNMQKYPYSDWVAGTLKTIIPPQFRGDKSIAGIEFLDPLGNCDGVYNGRRYFTSQPKHAAFISIDQIYVACGDAKQTVH